MRYTPPSANVPCKFKGFRTKQPKYGPTIVQHPVRRATVEVLNGGPPSTDKRVQNNVARFRKLLKDKGLDK